MAFSGTAIWENLKSLNETSANSSVSNRVSIWDGWRGMAIILLLTGHFFDRKWIWEDRLGVDAFFVLSGMLMSTILFEKRMPLKDFYIRRFSRIFPAFSLYVVIVFLLAFLANIIFEKKDYGFEIKELVSTLAFFRTYLPLEPHIWDTQVPIGHLWSLNVEEHAYIIMSILTLLIIKNKYAGYTLLGLGLVSIGICFYYFYNESIAPNQFRIRTESAVSFVFLSAGYNLIKKRFNISVYSFIPPLTLLLAFICYLTDMPEFLTFSVAPILLAFTLNHISEAHAFLRNILELRVFRYMGTWSFSIYLWQQLFYQFKWAMPGSQYGALFLAISSGVLSFYFFENPIRAWINNRWTKSNSH